MKGGEYLPESNDILLRHSRFELCRDHMLDPTFLLFSESKNAQISVTAKTAPPAIVKAV